MGREPSNLTQILSDARTKLNEAKSMQFFGSDALIVNEFHSGALDGKKWEQVSWILILTPTSPAGVLPCSVELVWDNPLPSHQLDINFGIKPVRTLSGSLAWKINGASDKRYETSVAMSWLGSGIVTLERTDV